MLTAIAGHVVIGVRRRDRRHLDAVAVEIKDHRRIRIITAEIAATVVGVTLIGVALISVALIRVAVAVVVALIADRAVVSAADRLVRGLACHIALRVVAGHTAAVDLIAALLADPGDVGRARAAAIIEVGVEPAVRVGRILQRRPGVRRRRAELVEVVQRRASAPLAA